MNLHLRAAFLRTVQAKRAESSSVILGARMIFRSLSAFGLLVSTAAAHEGHVHGAEIGTTWTWDPWVLFPLTLAGGLYATGVARLWRRVGPGGGVRFWQAAAFALGWVTLVVALVSPLHWLGERLFTVHMIEHELLMMLAAPCLVLARPIGPALWALPSGLRHGVAAGLRAIGNSWPWFVVSSPAAATLIHGAALWLWHLPALYQSALVDERVHWIQHASFLLSALLFWWALLQGRDRRRGLGPAVLYLFATATHSSLLGVLIALASRPIYPVQTASAPGWGLDALEDQQLAGLIMWVPGGLVYTIAGVALAGLWIAPSSRALPRG
jgi:putative membrane protein